MKYKIASQNHKNFQYNSSLLDHICLSNKTYHKFSKTYNKNNKNIQQKIHFIAPFEDITYKNEFICKYHFDLQHWHDIDITYCLQHAIKCTLFIYVFTHTFLCSDTLKQFIITILHV